MNVVPEAPTRWTQEEAIAFEAARDCITHLLADAVLDRIVHKAHRVNLKGESMRKVMAKKTFQAV